MTKLSGTHDIGPSDGNLTVHTTRAGVGAKIGHDLVLEAKQWKGSVTFNTDDLRGSHVELTIDTTSLEVLEASGGMKPMTDGDRKDIAKNINDKVLQTKKHPEITFESTSVTGGGTDFTVGGELTIAGTTRPVSVQVTVDEGAGRLTAEATVVQTDFGIKPYSAMLGALKVADPVTIKAALTLPG